MESVTLSPKEQAGGQEQGAADAGSFLSELGRIAVWIVLLLVVAFALGVLWGYLRGYPSLLWSGSLFACASIVLLYLLLQLRSFLMVLFWLLTRSFRNVGGYLGALIVPVAQIYLYRERGGAGLSRGDSEDVLAISILALFGAVIGSVCYALIRRIPLWWGVVGGLCFNGIMLINQPAERLQWSPLFFYQLGVGLLSGACLVSFLDLAVHLVRALMAPAGPDAPAEVGEEAREQRVKSAEAEERRG